MANKRMFNNSVLDTDAFLELPLSTQALYFHLNLRADDDGFISNPKRVQSYIGASEDDLKLLILKSFVISFDDGVIVIKHWRMHNTIQKDRYHPTNYQEDLKMLGIKENKAYTLDENQMETKCIQNGNSLETTCKQNVSSDLGLGLDKDLDLDIDLDLDKGKKAETEPKAHIDYQKIINSFNEICTSYPQVKSLSDARKKAIRARLNTYSEADIVDAFYKAEQSDFLKGKNNRNWTANFDWIMKDSNLAKILDGNYDNSTNQSNYEQQPSQSLYDKWMNA